MLEEFSNFINFWFLQAKSVSAKMTLQVLGLEVCADTIVGDQMKRGISGGQRKRLTTGRARTLELAD